MSRWPYWAARSRGVSCLALRITASAWRYFSRWREGGREGRKERGGKQKGGNERGREGGWEEGREVKR